MALLLGKYRRHQYVGDEIVIAWVEADGVADARSLRCFFAIRVALAVRGRKPVSRIASA
jgi:adenylate cyclase